MKKVLIIGMSSILGGVETYLYNLVKYINRDKYTFDFLVIGNSKVSVFEKEINDLFEDGVTHFYYSPNLKKEYLNAHRWLRNFYKTHKYDLIYMNTCTAARINYCKYALRAKGTKLITHSHNGNGLSPINNFIFRGKVKRNSARKLSCSDVAAEWLFGKNQKDIVIVPNGVDTERFTYNEEHRNNIRNQLGIATEKIVIGHVGRFYAQKNQFFLIDLCKKLEDKFVFLCIGDGELKNDFLRKIESERLSERFFVLSSKADIEKYYSAMDVFAMPSIFEGLPIVAVEAQSVGLPCIFSSTISKQIAFNERSCFISIEDIDEWVVHFENLDIMKYDGKMTVKQAGFDMVDTIRLVERQFDEVLQL